MRRGVHIRGNTITIKLLIIALVTSSTIIVLSTPIHESTHWIMSEIDPYIEPIEFHIFDSASFQKGDHILASALGYITIREKYPGAFNDRPEWADAMQEMICISIQIILAVVITLKILQFLIHRNSRQIISF